MGLLFLGATICGTILALHLLFRFQLYVQREQVRVYRGKKYRIQEVLNKRTRAWLGFKVEVAGWTQWKDFKFWEYGPESYASVEFFDTEEEADREFKKEFDSLAECWRKRREL